MNHCGNYEMVIIISDVGLLENCVREIIMSNVPSAEKTSMTIQSLSVMSFLYPAWHLELFEIISLDYVYVLELSTFT